MDVALQHRMATPNRIAMRDVAVLDNEVAVLAAMRLLHVVVKNKLQSR